MQVTIISFDILSDFSVEVTHLYVAICVFVLLKIYDRVRKKRR